MEPKVKSLDKALKILDCFSTSRPELGITEISNELDLYKSNVHNIISTFEQNGYLEQNKETGKYRLSLKLLQLSHIVSTTMGYHSIVRRCLQELSASIDEIIYFGIPDGDRVMYMDGVFPEKHYQTRWVQGMTAPLVCTAIGKAMLAYMDDSFIDQVLQKPLERFTDYTITDPDTLREELRKTRAQGYSTDNMEHEFGVKCVGVPVFDRSGRISGAFSTTGPSLRFTEEQSQIYIRILKDKAEFLRQNS